MRRQVTVFILISFILALSPALVSAQEAKADVKKKEFEEQKKKEAELIKQLQKEEAFFKQKTAKEAEEQYLENAIHKEELMQAYEEARAISVTSGWDEGSNYVFSGDVYGRNPIMLGIGSSQSSSSMQYSKSVKEASFTRDMKFEVEEDAHKASITVSGSCKTGEIRIKIMMPDGKPYTEVLIDEYGSVNWSKSFAIDEENTEKTGEWKFIISAKDASGNFRLSIMSH